MAFTPQTINKELDMANLAKHNANYSAIKTELDAHDAHVAAQTAHGSTPEATAGKIMQRDSAGRAKVAAPSASDDVARKAEVDVVQANLDAHEADSVAHLSTSDREKLDGLEVGAEANQNAFAQVNNVVAGAESDTLTIAGGTGITVSTNPTTKTLTVTATGEATPGAHGSSHNTDGADPIPDLVALRDEFDALTPADIGAETPAGAQAKVEELSGQTMHAINVIAYGAVGDGVTDDFEAIQAASDYCTANNGVLFFPATTFYSSQTVVFENCNVQGTGAVLRSAAQIGVEIGTPSNAFQKSIYGLSVTRENVTAVPTNSVGYSFVNVSNAMFVELKSSHHDKGIYMAPGEACRVAYCTFIHPYVHRCNRSWHIYVNGTGYAAENTVIGGRMQMVSTRSVDYHIYAERTTGSAAINHWQWYGVSMESSSDSTNAISAMNLKRVDSWLITGVRTEGNWTNGDIALDANCSFNRIEALYTDGTFSVNDLGSNNVLEFRQERQVSGMAEYFKRGVVNSTATAESSSVAMFHREGASKIHVVSDGTSSPSVALGSAGNTSAVEVLWVPSRASMSMRVGGTNIAEVTSAALRPYSDNVVSLGGTSNRWTQVYAATGTISTSDRDEKQQIGDIPDEVLDAWSNVQYSRFKFNDAVQRKGDEARWHVGLIAQDIKDVFEARGLDATHYGLLCFDEWGDSEEIVDEAGNIVSPPVQAGSRWGVRFDECQFLEMALMRRELKRLQFK